MTTTGERLQQRNQEIGTLLAEARQRQHRSVSECASLLETSRRRYRAIEHGEAAVSAAELEILMGYLDLPAHAVWSDVSPSGETRQVVVHARPGETVQLVVAVQG